jgi:homoserine kinase
MNDTMIAMAQMRSSEMIREAGKDKLAARVRRTARQTTRAARAAARPTLQLVVSGARPTATGR